MRSDSLISPPPSALEALATRVATTPRSLDRKIELGGACAVVAVMVRLALDPLLGAHLPFSTFFPALLVAGVFGGLWGGLTALGATTLAGWCLFVPPRFDWQVDRGGAIQAPVYLVIGAATVLVAVILRDALIRLEASSRRHEILIGELQHRLKTNMAMVQSLADQTLRSTPDPTEFKHAFTDRLITLGEAHDLLRCAGWRGVELRRLISVPLRPFAPTGSDRIVITGPDVLVGADVAVTLALCFRELAANAARHGALATPAGRVKVDWTVTARTHAPRVELVWTEIGGPPPSRTTRRGFGSRLLDQGLGAGAHWQVQRLPGLLSWRVAFSGEDLPDPAAPRPPTPRPVRHGLAAAS